MALAVCVLCPFGAPDRLLLTFCSNNCVLKTSTGYHRLCYKLWGGLYAIKSKDRHFSFGLFIKNQNYNIRTYTKYKSGKLIKPAEWYLRNVRRVLPLKFLHSLIGHKKENHMTDFSIKYCLSDSTVLFPLNWKWLKKTASVCWGQGRLHKSQTSSCGSVCGCAAVPETGPEVITAGHEARVGWWVDDAADNVIVTQRQQVFPLGCAGVPAAEADGALVGQQHVVLRVVEHALRTVHLTAAQPCACNRWARQVSLSNRALKKML